MRQVECTKLSQRLIHGEVRTEVCKVAVGAFVLALVISRVLSGTVIQDVDRRSLPCS